MAIVACLRHDGHHIHTAKNKGKRGSYNKPITIVTQKQRAAKAKKDKKNEEDFLDHKRKQHARRAKLDMRREIKSIYSKFA